jgi:hypothetical protein
MGFLDRFKQLEIPEEKRRIDWSFLDESLALPEPLPLAEFSLVCLLNGQAWEPVDQPPGAKSILFHGDPVDLVERATATAAEEAWRASHERELARQAQLFLDGIPTGILRDTTRVEEALEILQLNAPPTALLDNERLLRIFGKLYNLVTLHDYARIFEKAIDPGFFRELQALPATVTPEEMAAKIAGSLTLIHKKARSPLRNKLECARVVLDGVTLLPLYREPAASLFEAWRRILERRLKVEVLKRHA